MTAFRPSSRFERWFLPAWCCSIGGCLVPPALLPPFDVDLERALADYPPGTETVDLALSPEEHLRGLFVPSDEGAPVVLHLLESSGSVASCRFGYGELCAELSDLGFASLLVDYTGIGISDGKASVENLERDARAMWEEAVRRAGGEEDRVVVRAVSLGTISTALLLEDGARPRAVVLLAPVLPESVVPRFARMARGPFAAWFASLAYRDVAAVDVALVIRETDVPVYLLASDDDPLLGEEDREALYQAAWLHGGGLYRRAGDHVLFAIEAHVLLGEERPLYPRFLADAPPTERRVLELLESVPPEVADRFAPNTEARVRLAALSRSCRVGDPLVLAAAALANERGESAARMVWLHRRRGWPVLGFDDLVSALSLDDPAGDLPIDLVEDHSRPIDLPANHGGVWCLLDGNAIVGAAQARGLGSGGWSWSTSISLSGELEIETSADHGRLLVDLLARGLCEDDARRQFVRILMKAHRIPDRLTRAQDGTLVLEAFEEGAWRELDLSRPPPQGKVFLQGSTGRSQDVVDPRRISANE